MRPPGDYNYRTSTRGSRRWRHLRRAIPRGSWRWRWGWPARQALQRTDINFYVGAAIVGALTASLGGLGAQLAGSATVELAMVASTLLLVPGVAATNAQADIMDGYPTMGSARAVSLIMTMAFVTIGLWLAQFLVGVPE